MISPAKFVVSAAFACGFAALVSSPASAMPVAKVAVDAPTEQAHAVRVCNRGRCWWTTAGHWHGRRWARPYPHWRYGWRPGWGHPRYGYGWRHGWRGGGWRGHGHWR